MFYVDIEPICVFCRRPTTEVLERRWSARIGPTVVKQEEPYPAHRRCRFIRALPKRVCYGAAICSLIAMPVIFTEVIPQYAQAGLVAWFVAPIGLALLGFILGGRVDGPITDYVLTHKHPLGFTAHQPLSNALNKPRHRQ